MKATDKARKQMAKRNLWGNINPHKPDGRTSRELTKRVRLRCLMNGGDPGYVVDVKAAMMEISWEEPALQRGVFHPDYLARVAGSWAFNWRQMEQKTKDQLMAEFEELKNQSR